MVKNFVIDTNILIHNPNCLTKFEDNNIIVPHFVIEELDGLKKSPGEVGYFAREATRKIGELREKGDITKGVKLEDGGVFQVFFVNKFNSPLPSGWKADKMDNLILLSVLELAKEKANVILVTNDTNMQIKADVLGIPVQEYKNDRIQSLLKIYKGRRVSYISEEGMSAFARDKRVDDSYFLNNEDPFTVNEYVNLITYNGGSMLAQYNGKEFVGLRHLSEQPFGLKKQSLGQDFLKESLMASCEDKPLVICNGPAGTGKTLFAVGCGLEQVMEIKKYKRVLVARANVKMDEDIGALPGSEMEKISPLLRGVYDNLEVLLSNEDDSIDDINDKIMEVFQRGYIDAQSLAYFRGRSVNNTFIIIDEAQNCTPTQIETIITRAGFGSKVVLLGDVNQIDNMRLDSKNNGLAYAIEVMKGSPKCDVITFKESECRRSELAKEATERFNSRKG